MGYRRRKQFSLSTPIILTLAFGSILILLLYNAKLEIQTSNLITPLLISTFILFLMGIAFIFWIEKTKRAKLKSIKLSQIDSMTGIEFEKYVGELLKFQGYKIEFTSTSHDFGVDIVAKRDGIKTAVQLKRYSDTVGRAAVSDAVAGMAHYKCNNTMVVTSYYFTKEAKTLALSNNCILVDRDKLSGWIYNFQK